MNKPLLPCRKAGAVSITAVSDGYLSASLDLLSNIDQVDTRQLQYEAGAGDPTSIHINCYLVRLHGRTILIDAGAGGFRQWGGQLKANLALIGVRPSEIDSVILTHAHPDHIGGLIDASGETTFPNAELVIHQQEVAFWQDDSNFNRANERARGNFLFAREIFGRYRANMRTFTGSDVLPQISTIALPGHTAGHTGYRVESEGETVLVWGDIVHFPQIQSAYPNISIAFDQDPLLAADARTRLLDAASADRLLIAGMHLGQLGFARIERAGKGYRICYEELGQSAQ